MNIQVYQSFLTVVQCRSFTQAAKYLNFTQPTISNHITALEEEYGVILFTRDGKNVYLTQAGKNFVPIAQQIMDDYQKSQEVMRQFCKNSMSLKIGVSTQGINFYLLPVLLKLKKEFPELDLEVNRCMTVESTLEDAFTKKIYDFAFVHIDVQPLYTRRIKLWNQPMVLVVSKELYESMGCNDNVYDYPFIAYPDSEVYHKHLKAKIDFCRLKRFITFSDSESVLMAVQQNLGAALTPRIKVAKELEKGNLIEFPSKYSGNMPISVLYDYEFDFTLPSKRFLELLRESQEKIIEW
ncbi:MAG: LysR family transcriptional regulator [Phascolarctobacterium sp.]|nr:LysR family transcriptional regulator [Phascolarctobacterium sp.]